MRDLFGNNHPEPARPTVREPRCCTPLGRTITLLLQENPNATDEQIIQNLWEKGEIVSKGYGFSEVTARSVLADLRRAFGGVKGGAL